jgi:hypothetical protein
LRDGDGNFGKGKRLMSVNTQLGSRGVTQLLNHAGAVKSAVARQKSRSPGIVAQVGEFAEQGIA